MTRKCSATSCQMRFWRLRGANVGRGPRVPLRLDFAQGQRPAPGGRQNTGPNNFARRQATRGAPCATGRFPPPWSVEEQPACFVVTDSRGRVQDGFVTEPYFVVASE